MASRSRGRNRSQSGGDTTGSTPRARRAAPGAKRAGTRPKPKPDTSSIAEPTVTASDEVLAASNARRALSPDMPRVAWLRTQLQSLEAQRAERLVKIVQLALIAVIFAVFVLQNADPVDVNRSYRFEQGFTMELNLAGVSDEHRDAFAGTEKGSPR